MFFRRWGDKLVSMAIDAVKRVRTVVDGRVEVDVKRYARVEKIPGGEMEDCMVGRVGEMMAHYLFGLVTRVGVFERTSIAIGAECRCVLLLMRRLLV